jgi:hypothetical protein
MPEGIGYDNEITAELTEQEESEARKAQARKARQQEEALIDKWAEKIKRARKHDSKAREQWADDRRVARGDPIPGTSSWLVSTNLVAAIMEVLAAFLYAKNPDVSIRPSQSANKELTKEFRALAETLEIMVSRLFHDAGLKRVAKRWVRSAMTVGISWIKCAMQTRTERDPITETQINDLQDNLKQIEVKRAQLADGEADDTDVIVAEIRSKIVALEAKLEREVAEGLVLDIMAPEDVIVAPDCGEIENYRNAPWIAFDMYKDKDEALEITGWVEKDAERLSQANLYTQRPRKGEQDEGASTSNSTQWVLDSGEDGDGAENPDGFYRFIEIWSLRDGVVYTMVEGVQEKWARPKYAPRTGARFYPCFGLAFHPIDGERWPQSDVFQLKRLQEEYSRIRSNYAEHRRRAIPGVVFNETQIDKESIKKITKSTTQEWVGIKPLTPSIDMRTIFAPKAYNPVDPGLYNTEVITQEMEKVSGAQDAVQGGIQVEKTATEAQIQESGRGARTGARLDTLEDELTDMSDYTVQLMLQTMDRSDAQRYAGPTAMWMDMSTDEALTLFGVTVKAGSTGKPKALSDRESWGTLMPLIEGTIDRIGHARMQGQEWAAKPWIELLQESSKRLDDPLEIEKFLPEVPPEVVQATTGQQPSEEELAELRNTDADTLKKLAETLEKNPLFVRPVAEIVQDLDGQGAPAQAPIPPSANEIN